MQPYKVARLFLLACFIADIFGISDHNLMYSQEAVEAPEGPVATDQAAIEARVSFYPL